MEYLRIATFNIRNGRAFDGLDSWPLRRHVTLEAIQSLGAHVIGLQEVFGFQLRYLSKRLTDYTVIGESRSGGRFGERVPLLIRKDISVVTHETRWFGGLRGAKLPNATNPRIATLATIGALGQTIQIANTHLDQRHESNRKRSALELVSWLERSIPNIVMGDMNATPTATSIDTFTDAGFVSAIGDSAGTAHSFTGRADGPQIDYLMASEKLSFEHAEVVHFRDGNRLPSDHWPLVADVVTAKQGSR